MSLFTSPQIIYVDDVVNISRVGITGNYNDLQSTPTTYLADQILGLSEVATSGSYHDLSSTPSSYPASFITGLSTVAITGSYNNLTSTPNLASSSTSGLMSSLDKTNFDNLIATKDQYDYRKQNIIDGNFQISQAVGYDVGVDNPSNSSYPVFDVWQTNFDADGGTFPSITHSQQKLTEGDIYGSTYFYRKTVNGAGTSLGTYSYYDTSHNIENGVRNLCGNGKQVTVSFYARSSIANKRIGITLQQIYGTGGSATEEITGTNFTLTSNWTQYTYTFTTNTLASKTISTSNDDRLVLIFWNVWGSGLQSLVGASTAETFVGSGNIDMAQVQLSQGSVVHPFQIKTYEEELRSCKRFLQFTHNYLMNGILRTANDLSRVGCVLPVTMRIIPEITATGTINIHDGSSATVISTITAWYNSVDNISLDGYINSALQAGRPCEIYCGQGIDHCFKLDARF